MKLRQTIDNRTLGETILLAAGKAAMSVPTSKQQNVNALIALCSVQRWVQEYICVPQAVNMVTVAGTIVDKALHHAGRTGDEHAQNVYIETYKAAHDFAETLNHLQSEEVNELPF
jgi:gamma-glutamyl phosphate reductase